MTACRSRRSKPSRATSGVLWIGDPGRAARRSVRGARRHRLRAHLDGPGTRACRSSAPKQDADSVTKRAVSLALDGRTNRLGRIVAPMGVRYVALPSRNGPDGPRGAVIPGLRRAPRRPARPRAAPGAVGTRALREHGVVPGRRRRATEHRGSDGRRRTDPRGADRRPRGLGEAAHGPSDRGRGAARAGVRRPLARHRVRQQSTSREELRVGQPVRAGGGHGRRRLHQSAQHHADGARAGCAVAGRAHRRVARPAQAGAARPRSRPGARGSAAATRAAQLRREARAEERDRVRREELDDDFWSRV